MKKNNKVHKKENKNGAKIIDLTSYINPEQILSDVNGSYTGITADTFLTANMKNPFRMLMICKKEKLSAF